MSFFKKLFGINNEEDSKSESSDQTENNNNDELADLETRNQFKENIDNFGCHLCLFEADNYLPGFAYSIGLFEKFNHPEIICFGINTEVMAKIINQACDLIKEGEVLKTDKIYDEFLNNYPIQFIEVNKAFYANYLGYGSWYYGDFDFPVLQLIWTDKQSNFPWEEDFNEDLKFKQPLLDSNTDFKFYEERNLGVYTTTQVLEGEPILFVFHNEDGDWQFYSSSEPNFGESILVSLEQITKLDPTINEIYHLQYGYKAWRQSKDDDWEYEEDIDEEETLE